MLEMITSHHLYLFSSRSVLLPTSMMMTSLPLSVLTSSIHLQVCWNEFTSVEPRGSYYIQLFLSQKPNRKLYVFTQVFVHLTQKHTNVSCISYTGYSFRLTCNVIDNHSHRRVSYVARNEAPETLLSSCVPQLQPYLHVYTHTHRHTRAFSINCHTTHSL